MAEDNTPENEKRNKPDRTAFNVIEGKNGNSNWYNIGYVYNHGDGKGATLSLHSAPLNGKVVMRDLRDKAMDGYNKQEQEKPVPSQTQQRQHGYEPER